MVGVVIEAYGRGSSIGGLCHIYTRDGRRYVEAEVVGFKEDRVLLMPLGELAGIGPGSRVVARSPSAGVAVGEGLLGRVVDGLGRPADGKGAVEAEAEYPLYGAPPPALERVPIREPLDLGVRAINGLLTVGRGQRLGIFAGSGVGKSTLLGMMARHTRADVNVIALIGERGREVREFIERDLGRAGLARSVVVVATSDRSPLERTRGAFVATAIAEYFRDQGRHVLLMMDSVTRLATAQREIGLAIGEPPTTRGFPPSVFGLLPKLTERAGTCGGPGTITGLYTVLVEGDDMNEPIADHMRGILDGHIVLSRELAARQHFPAIDVPASVSRLVGSLVAPDHRRRIALAVATLTDYQRAEDLINIGAYTRGNNPRVDRAIDRIGPLRAYLRQGVEEACTLEAAAEGLARIFPNPKEEAA
ncbi:MAG: FliI/YscN family ATPase [Nitrospirae bacterium]|nr:MAG: FliI/YscN family ATPase [Nitrospirota bacterium]